MMPCNMVTMTEMDMPHNMAASEHDMHMTMNDETTKSANKDCCQTNCDCATTCAQTSYLADQMTTLALSPISTDISNISITLRQENFLNYLFKPPIL